MRATQWAHRCQHEASQYDHNIFLTLTYDDKHLPAEGHLVPKHLTDFWKRLRKATPEKLRYFACGEYGEHTGRPHYHALIFNYRPPDSSKYSEDLYESAHLDSIWDRGRTKHGNATPAAANYIAQYNLKKQGQGNYDQDGVYRPAPFLRMSQGIGREWLLKYKDDLTHGYLVENARRSGIPRYYKEKIKTQHPELHARMLMHLQNYTMDNPSDKNEPARLAAGEQIHQQRKQYSDREIRVTIKTSN